MVQLAAPALLVLLLAAPAAAQAAQGPVERSGLHAHTFRHRNAEDVAPLIQGLLTPRGRLEVQDEGRTLTVRDTLGTLARVELLLRSLDRAVIPLDVEVLVVKATRIAVSPPAGSVPPELVGRLPAVLPYNHYELVARADLGSHEGEQVSYEVGAGYALRFRLGRLERGAVRFEDFQVFRGNPEQAMVRANLQLRLGETYSIGLSKSEQSPTALMLMLTCRHRPPLPGRR